jgi:hypothetical protein
VNKSVLEDVGSLSEWHGCWVKRLRFKQAAREDGSTRVRLMMASQSPRTRT